MCKANIDICIENTIPFDGGYLRRNFKYMQEKKIKQIWLINVFWQGQ